MKIKGKNKNTDIFEMKMAVCHKKTKRQFELSVHQSTIHSGEKCTNDMEYRGEHFFHKTKNRDK